MKLYYSELWDLDLGNKISINLNKFWLEKLSFTSLLDHEMIKEDQTSIWEQFQIWDLRFKI